MKITVIALGGNALIRRGEEITKETQVKNLEKICQKFVSLIKEGYKVIFTHGNGPQVGNLLLQSPTPSSLDVCVAQSEGEIGYLFQQVLRNKLKEVDEEREVISIITQVLVSKEDSAFTNPTKPIGKYYTQKEMEVLKRRKNWSFIKDEVRGGWRRVVASPSPLKIIEEKTIKKILQTLPHPPILIVCGGGGIPVVESEGRLIGVEAVVDKDLTASLLATQVGAKLFIILTDIEMVAINFNTPEQKFLPQLKVSEAKYYLRRGEFPVGSMGPKIEAAIRFLEHGGEEVIITSGEKLLESIRGEAGTHIIKEKK